MDKPIMQYRLTNLKDPGVVIELSGSDLGDALSEQNLARQSPIPHGTYSLSQRKLVAQWVEMATKLVFD